jgi:hypothetical protein
MEITLAQKLPLLLLDWQADLDYLTGDCLALDTVSANTDRDNSGFALSEGSYRITGLVKEPCVAPNRVQTMRRLSGNVDHDGARRAQVLDAKSRRID